MTKDVQHDRSASPLASVSDEIHVTPQTQACLQTRDPDGSGPEAHPPASDTTSTFDSDSFAGFGSFG